MWGWSRIPLTPKLAKRAGGGEPGEPFFLLLINHVKTAGFGVEADVVHAQHAHPEADLGLDRIEQRMKASSVMLKSVRRTGMIRFLLQIKRVSADCIGMISSVPDFESALFDWSCWLVG